MSCQRFVCGWLSGLGSTKDRPDKIRAMITSNPSPFKEKGIQFQAYKTSSQDADWSHRAKELINQLCEYGVVIHVNSKMREVLGGPRREVQAFQMAIQHAMEQKE